VAGRTAAFSTFCHISDYGDEGYRSLPKMIAMSRPCLWAPSSSILKSGLAGVSPDKFLHYVERDQVRILGRYDWLQDPAWRRQQTWQGASWDDRIDGAIRDICNEDSSKPLSDRRVCIAPEEKGYDFADSYLEAHPEEVAKWQRRLQSKVTRSAIPLGTLEAALRDIDDPHKSARRILRDAFNHGQAIAYSGADAPFILDRIRGDFLRILAQAPLATNLPPAVVADVPAQAHPEALSRSAAELTTQLLEILAELDIHSRNRGEVDSLDGFIRGGGRQDLMQWMARICTIAKQADAKKVDSLILRQLRSDLHDGHFENVFRESLTHLDDAGLGSVSVVSSFLGAAADPRSALALIGVGAVVYPIGRGLMRQLGYVSSNFSGPQWPFLYSYGTRPKRRQRKQLTYVLEQIDQRSQRR
jgi:hypothetical protein